MSQPATNRQKKVLRFFEVNFHPRISFGAAGWELGRIFSEEKNAVRWRKYLYLTEDFDSDTDQLLPYDEDDLEKVVIPEEWNAQKAIKDFREETAAQILESESPFDSPQPDIIFADHSFCFTGKFDFGPRKECENLISEKGGIAEKGVSAKLDYLVVGTQGSPKWKRGSYGAKIEKAVYLRRENGRPAIVSEDHCLSFLGQD